MIVMCLILSYNDEKYIVKLCIEIIHSLVAYYFWSCSGHCP